jgi:hypothetical protein
MSNEMKILALEIRRDKLAARGPWNLNIIRKINRKIKQLQASE